MKKIWALIILSVFVLMGCFSNERYITLEHKVTVDNFIEDTYKVTTTIWLYPDIEIIASEWDYNVKCGNIPAIKEKHKTKLTPIKFRAEQILPNKKPCVYYNEGKWEEAK